MSREAVIPERLAPGVNLADVPFHPQLEHHCGPAALITVLGASGVHADYGQLVERVYVPGLEGSLQVEMLAAAREHERIPFRLPGTLGSVLSEVEAGRPVLVLLNLRLRTLPAWHYAVVVGYEREQRRILMRSGRERELWTGAGKWMRQWDWAGRWAAVVLEPGELPLTVDRAAAFRALADFDEHARPGARRAAWRAAAVRWPDAALAHLGVGNSEYALGRVEEAASAFATALALEPDHAPARLNLATVELDLGLACQARGRLDSLVLPAAHPLAETLARARERARVACPTVAPEPPVQSSVEGAPAT